MRAAFYECNVTPPLGGYFWGNGYEMRAENIIEDLYAKAVVVEQSNEIFAMLCVDSCALPDDMHDIVTKRIFEYTGIPAERVCISSGHNHRGVPILSSPEQNCFRDETYTDVFFRRAADAVILAYKRLDDATAKFGVTKDYDLTMNRDYVLKDGRYVTHRLGREITGTLAGMDPDVSVLMFEREGKPFGAVINFACHQANGGSWEYHGDFSCIMAKELKKIYGEDFVSVFAQGTCGDVADIYEDSPEEFHHKIKTWQEFGRVLAKDVVKATENATAIDGNICVVKEKIKVKKRMTTPEIMKKTLVEFNNHEDEFKRRFQTINLVYYDAINKDEYSELIVQAIKFGDLCIYALPGEMYVNFGLAIKERSSYKYNMVVELCNCYCGYIPTEECFLENAQIYEAALCVHSCHIPQAGKQIVDKALELAESLKDKE